MRKNYNLTLLSLAIAFLVTLVANYVLQSYFGSTSLTIGTFLETIIMMGIAFMFLIQFANYQKIVAIITIIYGGFNLLYAIVSRSMISNVVATTEVEVLTLLGLLIGHVLFEVAALFNLVQNTKARFENKFASRLILVTLSVSLLMLALVSPFLTQNTLGAVIRQVVAILAIGLFYALLYICVKNTKEVETIAPSNQALDKEKLILELHGLYQRGMITSEEYETRKQRILQS